MSKGLLGIDVGTKRIGLAVADTSVRIAVPYDTITVDGTEVVQITEIIEEENIVTMVVGYPRNQSGEATAQTEVATDFATQFTHLAVEVVFQDESLTSVMAEDRLKSSGRPYTKGDIDAQAAAILLQDYIEGHYEG